MQTPLTDILPAGFAPTWPGIMAPISSVTSAQWTSLYERVEGRLSFRKPFAGPCFTTVAGEPQDVDETACTFIQSNYLDGVVRAASLGAMSNTQWEGCQATGDTCLLDWKNPKNASARSTPYTCEYGSVSKAYVEVAKYEDVQHALEFAKAFDVPLVISNTGHDYKGRSSAPHSLGISIKNLKNISFHPNFIADGCNGEGTLAITTGAGVIWKDAYEFADKSNVTIVGGTDPSVGTTGGWLQGGGHGALSNVYGMGADNALQFKVVTPTGKYLIANECQNEDLFFALRGGGGGTFGVVMEATHKVAPQTRLQVTFVSWAPEGNLPDARTKALWTIALDNGLSWAEKGYGGYIFKNSMLFVTPKLSAEEAKEAMAPLLQFGQTLVDSHTNGAIFKQLDFDGWAPFYNTFLGPNPAMIGAPQTLATRLIPKSMFDSASSRETLLEALLSAYSTAPDGFIMATTPVSYPGDNTTSINPAWRDALYHVAVTADFNYDATLEQKRSKYEVVSRAIDALRAVTPDAAYVNEADVHEPNYQESFWGAHYERLLEIKHKYDPDHVLDCWQCVGWNASSERYSCYI